MLKAWQVRLIFIVGIISVAIVFAIDYRGFVSLFSLIFSFALIYFGNRIFVEDTSENWLKFTLSDTAKSVIGYILVFFGGILFLRGVLAIAIGALILKFS